MLRIIIQVILVMMPCAQPFGSAVFSTTVELSMNIVLSIGDESIQLFFLPILIYR